MKRILLPEIDMVSIVKSLYSRELLELALLFGGKGDTFISRGLIIFQQRKSHNKKPTRLNLADGK
jgi:hypothetical protein